MLIEYAKSFDKSIKKLKDKVALTQLKDLINELKAANSLREICNVVPIKNYPERYRIRTGDFRLVVRYIDGEISILLIEYIRRNEKTYRNYN